MNFNINLTRGLDRKQFEMCNFAPASSANGTFIVSSNLQDQYQYFVTSATTMYQYDPFEDGWQVMPSPSLVGAFGNGSCGTRHPWGPRAFATGGTTTTINTNLNLQRGLKGYKIRIMSGPNAGQLVTVKSNTLGTNSIITIEETMGTAFTASSEYLLYTGRIWVMCATNTTTNTQAGTFRYYDVATNVWASASVTGLPSTWGTDGRLIATPGYFEDFVVGTATSATSTTLVHTGKTWLTNNWANYQVRINSGTGAGQIRTIASNTSNTLTVSSAWTITPDATSQYIIEGNSDYLYLMGNNSATMYRYSISNNTWTTLAPTVARGGSAVAGMGGHWVWGVTSTDWKNESNFLNGRYIYSFRGNGTILDRYDIAFNTWENDIPYAPKADTIALGTGYVLADNYLYLVQTGGRVLKFNIPEQRMEPCSQLWYAQGSSVVGDRTFDFYVQDDSGKKLRWLYTMTHSQTTLFRMLLF